MQEKYVDITHILIKPLYMGLVINILIPTGFLFLIYLIEKGGGLTSKVGDADGAVFALLAIVAVGLCAYAFWLRRSLGKRPMIRNIASFDRDFTTGLMAGSRQVFILIASIAGLGVLYYFLTGQFRESVIAVVASFVVFQIVRPRYGYVYRLMEQQWEMAERGELLMEPE